MYVGTYDSNTMIGSVKPSLQQQQQQPPAAVIMRRGKISDVWGTLNKARSTPDLLGDRCLEEDEEDEDDEDENDERSSVIERERRETALQLQEPASIFNRPGFGSVAFRRSVSFRYIVRSDVFYRN